MIRATLVLLIGTLLGLGCKDPKSSAPVTGASATSVPGQVIAPDGTKTAAGATADAAPRGLPEPEERADGPTKATCEKLADTVGRFVADSMLPANADATKKAYVESLVKENRPNVFRFCLESATVEEADCVIAAKDYPTLAACERFRRQVPKDLVNRDEVTAEDCEKFFTRLKQYKLAEGVPVAEIDATKDQVVRLCQEKARPGTVACFIASRTYEEARRCP